MIRRLAAVTVLLALAGCSDEPSGTSPAPSPSSTSPSTTPPSVPTSTSSTPSSTPTPTPTPTPQSCVDKTLAAMSARQKAAQLVMTGIGAGGVTHSQLRVLSKYHPGGILLLGDSGSAAVTKQVVKRAVAATGSPNGVKPLVAADQEGGKVQRLQGSGFERMPSATVQSGWSDAELTRRATEWGEDLEKVGITLNLAPVADVVPSSLKNSNQPIGVLDRGYGSDPAEAGEHVAAFIKGMHAGGVATSIKHFPGLGRVRGNTDFSSGVVDKTTTAHDPSLGSFRAGIAAGTDLVMVATATYPKIDPVNYAVFSRKVIHGMLRGALGYQGVVIADDLGEAKQVASVSPGRRATRFIVAGGDIVITADPALTGPMISALATRTDLDDHVRRVLTLKQRRGALSCR